MPPRKPKAAAQQDSAASLVQQEAAPLNPFWTTVRENYRQRIKALQDQTVAADSVDISKEEKTLQDLVAQGEKIEIVKKADVFSEMVTESEQEIINKRVEQQRIQYLEYTKREERRKLRRIRALFPHVTEEEAWEALLNNKEEDEETMLLHFTSFEFLLKIRKAIALKSTPHVAKLGNLSSDQLEHYEKMMKKRSATQKKAATEERRKSMYKMQYGRLRLDDALKQLNEGSGSMEGWSEARVRAFKIMKDNPNAYYYRFNAPGEAQRNGQWTASERALFMKRLAEIGANGQWGIFSMAIPGRVGYQCSNFYRRLLERGEVVDPNYYIDAKGKAHYLFSTKKGENGMPLERLSDGEGTPMDLSRSNSDIGGGGAASASISDMAAAAAAALTSGIDAVGDSTAAATKSTKARAKKATVPKVAEPKAPKAAASGSRKKKPTKKRRRFSSDSEDSEEYDEDDSRDYGGRSNRSWSTTRRTRARLEVADSRCGDASVSSASSVSSSSSSSSSLSSSLPSSSSSSASASASAVSSQAVADSAAMDTSGEVQPEEEEMEEQDEEQEMNPLRGFIDPITLDEVVKPAISPFGHVMGYHNWLRCLNSEDRKNICPFTKKPLKKRELVVLTHENIEEYRSKIVNINR